jgi:hypothetical protein
MRDHEGERMLRNRSIRTIKSCGIKQNGGAHAAGSLKNIG